MMKMVKKYICFVPLLLVALLSNVNADDPTFTFKIVNNSDKDVYAFVFDKDGGDVMAAEKVEPGQTYDRPDVPVKDPYTSKYAVGAIKEPYSWDIASGKMNETKKTALKAEDTTSKFRKGESQDFTDTSKKAFKGNAATFDLTYDTNKKIGTFTVNVTGKTV